MHPLPLTQSAEPSAALALDGLDTRRAVGLELIGRRVERSLRLDHGRLIDELLRQTLLVVGLAEVGTFSGFSTPRRHLIHMALDLRSA